MAGPLRGGGGEGRAIKEKTLFFVTFFYFVVFKSKNTLLKTSYQNSNTANVGKVVVF